MSKSLKNYLSLNKLFLLGSFVLLLNLHLSSQIANYVSNGSFEDIHSCAGPIFPLSIVKNWMGPDTACPAAGYFGICNNMIPLNGNTYQFPFKGNSHIISTIFIPSYPARGYPRNRLKSQLEQGRKYCVKFYINIANTSPYGMDGVGAYFGGSNLDTITKCNVPLVYLSPQIQNPTGNVITDTLNWVPISGTFTAIGDEKYMLLGNFIPDNSVSTASIGGPAFPQLWTDVLFDYVSCIDIELPAYAGPDKNVIVGDSVYIGRKSDVEIDESCIWYQMTSPTTSITIDTIAGLYVKPVVTSTYVVRQQLWCSGVKWDTVVVHMDFVGLEEQGLNTKWRVNIFPNPTSNQLGIISNKESESLKIIITDLSDRIILTDYIQLNKFYSSLDLNLINGAYFITLINSENESVTKKLLISK